MSHEAEKTSLWNYHTNRQKRKRLERIRQARQAEAEYYKYYTDRQCRFDNLRR